MVMKVVKILMVMVMVDTEYMPSRLHPRCSVRGASPAISLQQKKKLASLKAMVVLVWSYDPVTEWVEDGKEGSENGNSDNEAEEEDNISKRPPTLKAVLYTPSILFVCPPVFLFRCPSVFLSSCNKTKVSGKHLIYIYVSNHGMFVFPETVLFGYG